MKREFVLFIAMVASFAALLIAMAIQSKTTGMIAGATLLLSISANVICNLLGAKQRQTSAN